MKGKAILTTGAVIFNNKNQVLLVRHTKKASHLTGTYGIPAGRPYKDEEIIHACIREVKEETGLNLQREELKRFPYVYYAEIERKDGKKHFVLIAYYTNKFSGKLSPCEENKPIWMNIEELSRINLLSNQQELINRTFSMLSKNGH